MSFNLTAIKNKQELSDKFLDVEKVMLGVLYKEKFEDELQALLESVVDAGNQKGYLYLKVSKRDRAHVTVDFTSDDIAILHYELGTDLHQDNIKNMAKACTAIGNKLHDLGLTIEFRPHPDMGAQLSFDNLIENQTYDNTFVIDLKF